MELELRERPHTAEHEKTHHGMDKGEAQIDRFQPVNLGFHESLVHSRSHQSSTGIINSDRDQRVITSGTTRPIEASGTVMPTSIATVGTMSVIEVRRCTSPLATPLPKKITGTCVS